MTLETERLLLETWELSDWLILRPIATDPQVMRYITAGVPWTDEQIQHFVSKQVEMYSQRGFCRWKLLIKATHEFIGFCGIGFWRDAPTPEIGWWLAPQFWGQGLATEAACTALQDAFIRINLERVISIARCTNKASIRVMEKLGLTLEEQFETKGLTLVRYAIGRQRYLASNDTPARLTLYTDEHQRL